MHIKYNTKWWHNIFYVERGTYSTESSYWDVRVFWIFNFVIYEQTIDWGFIRDGKRISTRKFNKR